MHIIASDFDRTLYVEDENVLKMNIQAINKFISKGNTFIIITGRMYTDIKLLLDKYNINYTFLICEDGAKIFNECIDAFLNSAIVTLLFSLTSSKQL